MAITARDGDRTDSTAGGGRRTEYGIRAGVVQSAADRATVDADPDHRRSPQSDDRPDPRPPRLPIATRKTSTIMCPVVRPYQSPTRRRFRSTGHSAWRLHRAAARWSGGDVRAGAHRDSTPWRAGNAPHRAAGIDRTVASDPADSLEPDGGPAGCGSTGGSAARRRIPTRRCCPAAGPGLRVSLASRFNGQPIGPVSPENASTRSHWGARPAQRAVLDVERPPPVRSSGGPIGDHQRWSSGRGCRVAEPTADPGRDGRPAASDADRHAARPASEWIGPASLSDRLTPSTRHRDEPAA